MDHVGSVSIHGMFVQLCMAEALLRCLCVGGLKKEWTQSSLRVG